MAFVVGFNRGLARSMHVGARLPMLSCKFPTAGRSILFRVYSSYTTASSIGPRRSRLGRVLRFSATAITFTFIGASAVMTNDTYAKLRTLGAIPSDEQTVAMFKAPDEAAAFINNHLTEHPLATKLRADPSWSESRPHLKYPEEHKKHSLTAGTLMGPGRVPVPPLVFTDGPNLVALSYLSTDLCGHVGVVHGGMTATMMDESLARCGFNSLPNHIGVTARLTINYRKPVRAGSYVVLKAATAKVEGRKVWVIGRLETLGDGEEPGVLLAEAEGLFVEPKYAKYLPQIFEVTKAPTTKS